MFSLNFLKKSGPDTQSNRCHFEHRNGRRCRLPIADPSTQFCGTHRDMLARAKTHEDHEADLASVYAEVMGPIKSLDSAVAINHVLSNLFRLTLQGRIPQRKAAQLTTQLRLALRTAEAAKHEITSAKLFPHNNAELLNLLALLNGDEAESETVAPHSSAAAFSASNSTSDRELKHSAVPASVGCPEPAQGARPGSGETDNLEEPDLLSNAINHETVAPQSTAAVFATPNSISDSEPTPTSENTAEFAEGEFTSSAPCTTTTSPTLPNPPTQPSHSTDGVCWIGPKPDQIDWARVEDEKQEYERYLRRAYPPTLNGYHRIPPDEIPLYMRRRK